MEATCEVDGCTRPRRGNQPWCERHYHALRPKGVCLVDGCDGRVDRHGMCSKHYTRWKRHGDVADAPPRSVVPCSIDDCNKVAQSYGLCSTHYARLRRHGDPNRGRLPSRDPYWGTEFKTCSRCGIVKPRTEFTKNQASKDGLMHSCRECSAQRQRDLWANDYERMSARERKRTLAKYGLTLDTYDELLEQQGGGCAICGGGPTKKGFMVDHCHDTGATRGILCTRCNAGLGQFQHDPDLMRAAISYLASPPFKHKE